MKKIACMMFLMALIAVPAQAVVTITWLTPTGGVTDKDSNPAPAGWLVQFIHITNGGTMSTPTPGNPFPLSGDETLLTEQTLNGLSADGNIAGPAASGFAIEYADDSLAGGYAYARAYNVASSTSTGQSPSYYGVSAQGGNPANSANGNVLTVTTSDPTTSNNINPILSVNMPIPEPSTYALMALGGVVVLVRSRRKQDD